jgi:hypothetical protein
MDLKQETDLIYEAFCHTLPFGLQRQARELPFHLRLAPDRRSRWSDVFTHEVTLAAPAMFTEAMAAIHPTAVRSAVLAHMLAVIHAFGVDRIQDGQVPSTPELVDILEHARQSRDLAIRQVGPLPSGEAIEFAPADREVVWALQQEREAIAEGSLEFGRYKAISLRKQAVGLPASLALARAALWGPAQCRAVARTLGSIALWLQMYDDVVDWEDDLRRGGAWPVMLAMDGADRPSGKRPTEPGQVRQMVLGSGVMARMLAGAYRQFHGAGLRAQALGARQLARWARGREEQCRLLAEKEVSSAGYAVRAYSLAPWSV